MKFPRGLPIRLPTKITLKLDTHPANLLYLLSMPNMPHEEVDTEYNNQNLYAGNKSQDIENLLYNSIHISQMEGEIIFTQEWLPPKRLK